MPRQMPFRPRSEQVAQTYPDGYVDIYNAEDAASPGYQPKIRVTKVCRLKYEKQALGINRVYLSRQNHAEIKKVVRVPRREVTPFQLARDEAGQWFRIELVQDAMNVYPPSLDLSLSTVTADVEVQNEMA